MGKINYRFLNPGPKTSELVKKRIRIRNLVVSVRHRISMLDDELEQIPVEETDKELVATVKQALDDIGKAYFEWCKVKRLKR